MSMTIWSLAISAGLVLLTWFAARLDRRTLLVVAIHNGVWIVGLLLIASRLIVYDEASPTAWLTLCVGLLLFNVGAAAAVYLPSRRASPAMALAPLMSRAAYIVLAVIYAIAFIVYGVIQVTRVGIERFVENPVVVRNFDGLTSLESTPFVVRVMFYLAPILFAALAYRGAIDRPFPIWLSVIGLVLLGGSMLALFQRTNLFFAVLIAVGLLLSRGPARAKPAGTPPVGGVRGLLTRPAARFLVAGVAGAVLLIGSFQLNAAIIDKTEQAESTGRVSPLLVDSGLTSGYIYASSGITGFLALVDSNDSRLPPVDPDHVVAGGYNPVLWGAASFYPVARYLPGAVDWAPIEPFIDMGIATNVYTWNGPIYRDFRVPGVAIAAAAAGLLIAWAHRERFRSTRLYWVQAILISALFLSTFAGPTQWATLEAAVYLIVFVATSRVLRTAAGRVRDRLQRGRADR